MQYVQACIWSKAMIIIDDVFNDPVINKRIVNTVKYYKVLKTYYLLTENQIRELLDAEEKRQNIHLYRGSHDLTELEADYIEAHGGNVENEELLKFFFDMGGHAGIWQADNVIIRFKNLLYTVDRIKYIQEYMGDIRADISRLSSIFDSDVQYPQWVLDIPVDNDDSILDFFKQSYSLGYKLGYKLVRNNGHEYLVSCVQYKGDKTPKEFKVYFSYKKEKHHVQFCNRASAIDASWYDKKKSGTIRRTKEFNSRIESAVKLIEQWIKELETETKE